MAELPPLLLKLSLVVFMAGNLLDMGLRLQVGATLRGLRNLRFVAWTLVWGFALGPALALAITKVIPLAPPYAMGLILVGMTPCAPFLPMIIDRAKGDLAYTATFMVLTTFVMILVIYGKDLLGVPGSLALAAQLLFFSIVAGCSFQFAFGLDRAQRVVLSAGMATRNLGAAVAPLLSIVEIDQRAIVMVVLSLPVTVIFAMLVAALTRKERAAGNGHA